MFDGDFKVVGHARRQTDRVREHRTHPVVLRLQPVKGLVGSQSSGGMPINPTSSRPSDSCTCAQIRSTAPGVVLSTPPGIRHRRG